MQIFWLLSEGSTAEGGTVALLQRGEVSASTQAVPHQPGGPWVQVSSGLGFSLPPCFRPSLAL